MTGIDDLVAEAGRRLGIACDGGYQVAPAAALQARAFDPSWPLFVRPDDVGGGPGGPGGAAGAAAAVRPEAEPIKPAAFEAPVLPGRNARSGAAAILRDLYPASHPVHGLDGATDSTVGDVDDAILAAGPHVLPPLDPESNVASPHGLPWIVARLRAPDGCPWDREQTHLSLRPFLLEEAYEVYDALEDGATPELAGELGDLLLQVVLHAQHAAEAGVFDLSDVYRAIAAKIVRRHPHVFGDTDASTVGQVLRNWEQIKAAERAAQADVPAPEAGLSAGATAASAATASLPEAFQGLARSLPALAYAQEMQARAAALGYDWPDVEGVIEKLEEEAVELLEAEDDAQRTEEFGDLLLVLVNLARKLNIDAEAALRAGNRKFARRFALVERYAAERGRSLDRMTFDELDELWDAAKAEMASRTREEGA
jgi:tetrapyrrole methylase family protein/MazG family protein